MNTDKLMNRVAFLSLDMLGRVALVALIGLAAACSSGGAPTTVNQQTTPSAGPAGYTGPVPANADVQAFKLNLWENIRVADRCGGCHKAGGQSPQFARSDDVNLAYQAANPLVNFTQPDQSRLVIKVSSGHNCWVADPKACGDTMLTWIKAWVGAGSGASTAVVLTPPPSQTVGSSKTFPADSAAFQTTVYPLLRQFCAGCHRSDSPTQQQPFFASSNPDEAYAAAKAKINLDTPAQSRFVLRLRTEFHNCWATPSSNGSPDCAGSADAMQAAIKAFSDGITPTPVDAALVLSKALSLKQGTVASGGNRYESNLVARFEFKTGSGTTAYDTSGVNPAADLSLIGTFDWVGGWGISIGMGGRAQASTSASKKLSDMIKSTGEYSIETWAAPANVAQMNAYIVSYSGSATTRNATLGQHAMEYEARTRSDKTNANGAPPLLTNPANRDAQAALQHLVLTYDPVHGQKLYVNGNPTGDVDPSGGGSLANWDDTFALVLGNETSGNRQWQGVIKFVAIHSRALTPAQVQQNFVAGVGERYFLLFDVTALSGVPKSYIVMEGSQYDSYSYLFNKPTFLSLDPTAMPANLPIKGIRIGVNGTEVKTGQSYSTLSVTVGSPSYAAATGQLLSSVGAVIASDKGVDTDQFFLSFEQIGTQTHVVTEPVVIVTRPVDNTVKPDVGVRTFEQINATMAAVTGVPATSMSTSFNTLKQALPPTPRIDAFLSSHQTAISQLAVQYCGTLVSTPSLFNAFFTGVDLSQPADAYFSTAANRNLVINPLVARAIGTNVNAAAATAASAELHALMVRLSNGSTGVPGNSPGRTAFVTKAACAALLGSAAVSLQ
jgi:hypothetical protein